MPDIVWQKSSYSSAGGGDECIELAATDPRTLHLRESDTPTVTLTLSRRTLRALLRYSRTAD
ncbi:DUF397 domain-containing protein [Streptomyces sp. UNOB3_S3]|uniref:DUF397 domain-containing protein n=1 Tax=Streptomyces sp. UNOB3_S3 TaxID=2871682 RepID=UPI001E5216B0|nr:DUF397 domain-containing protein [Streptomyces sp. UNOB3_S3]MCC3777777.1 DUF397 domain-containing protein [Streptomyces sp. UNOB3_S3]